MRQNISETVFLYRRDQPRICERFEAAEMSRFELAAGHNGKDLFVCGGRTSDRLMSRQVSMLGPDGAVTSVRPLPKPRCRHAVATTQLGVFLVVGGIVGESDGALALSRSILSYSVGEDKWREIARLPKRAAKMVAEVVGNELFVIAGDTGTSTIAGTPAAPAIVRDDVQILDLNSGQWRTGTPKPIRETGVTSAISGEEIYVVSSEAEDGTVTDSVEVYNTKTDRWRRIPDMPTPRTSVACGFLGERLYCINGQGRDLRPSSCVEIFDPETNSWSKSEDSLEASYGSGYANCGDGIWIVGGVVNTIR
jgi:serine/threonine-protein kinase PknK